MTETAILLAAEEAASYVAQVFSAYCTSNLAPYDDYNLDFAAIRACMEEYLGLVHDCAREAIVDALVYDTALMPSESASTEAEEFVEPRRLRNDNSSTPTEYSALKTGLTHDYLSPLEGDKEDSLHHGDLSPILISAQQSVEPDEALFETAWAIGVLGPVEGLA